MFVFLTDNPTQGLKKGPNFTNGSTIPESFLTGLGSTARSEVINYNLS